MAFQDNNIDRKLTVEEKRHQDMCASLLEPVPIAPYPRFNTTSHYAANMNVNQQANRDPRPSPVHVASPTPHQEQCDAASMQHNQHTDRSFNQSSHYTAAASIPVNQSMPFCTGIGDAGQRVFAPEESCQTQMNERQMMEANGQCYVHSNGGQHPVNSLAAPPPAAPAAVAPSSVHHGYQAAGINAQTKLPGHHLSHGASNPRNFHYNQVPSGYVHNALNMLGTRSRFPTSTAPTRTPTSLHVSAAAAAPPGAYNLPTAAAQMKRAPNTVVPGATSPFIPSKERGKTNMLSLDTSQQIDANQFIDVARGQNLSIESDLTPTGAVVGNCGRHDDTNVGQMLYKEAKDETLETHPILQGMTEKQKRKKLDHLSKDEKRSLGEMCQKLFHSKCSSGILHQEYYLRVYGNATTLYIGHNVALKGNGSNKKRKLVIPATVSNATSSAAKANKRQKTNHDSSTYNCRSCQQRLLLSMEEKRLPSKETKPPSKLLRKLKKLITLNETISSAYQASANDSDSDSSQPGTFGANVDWNDYHQFHLDYTMQVHQMFPFLDDTRDDAIQYADMSKLQKKTYDNTVNILQEVIDELTMMPRGGGGDKQDKNEQRSLPVNVSAASDSSGGGGTGGVPGGTTGATGNGGRGGGVATGGGAAGSKTNCAGSKSDEMDDVDSDLTDSSSNSSNDSDDDDDDDDEDSNDHHSSNRIAHPNKSRYKRDDMEVSDKEITEQEKEQLQKVVTNWIEFADLYETNYPSTSSRFVMKFKTHLTQMIANVNSIQSSYKNLINTIRFEWSNVCNEHLRSVLTMPMNGSSEESANNSCETSTNATLSCISTIVDADPLNVTGRYVACNVKSGIETEQVQPEVKLNINSEMEAEEGRPVDGSKIASTKKPQNPVKSGIETEKVQSEVKPNGNSEMEIEAGSLVGDSKIEPALNEASTKKPQNQENSTDGSCVKPRTSEAVHSKEDGGDNVGDNGGVDAGDMKQAPNQNKTPGGKTARYGNDHHGEDTHFKKPREAARHAEAGQQGKKTSPVAMDISQAASMSDVLNMKTNQLPADFSKPSLSKNSIGTAKRSTNTVDYYEDKDIRVYDHVIRMSGREHTSGFKRFNEILQGFTSSGVCISSKPVVEYIIDTFERPHELSNNARPLLLKVCWDFESDARKYQRVTPDDLLAMLSGFGSNSSFSDNVDSVNEGITSSCKLDDAGVGGSGGATDTSKQKGEPNNWKKRKLEDDGGDRKKSFSSYYTTELSDNCVLCERGGLAHHHVGNIKFRELIAKHSDEYREATPLAKRKLVKNIIDTIHGRNGQFVHRLTEDGARKRRNRRSLRKRTEHEANQALAINCKMDINTYIVADPKTVYFKVCQALREDYREDTRSKKLLEYRHSFW